MPDYRKYQIDPVVLSPEQIRQRIARLQDRAQGSAAHVKRQYARDIEKLQAALARKAS